MKAAKRGVGSGRGLNENHPSGAKARIRSVGLSGTTEVVPFQNRGSERAEKVGSFKTEAGANLQQLGSPSKLA